MEAAALAIGGAAVGTGIGGAVGLATTGTGLAVGAGGGFVGSGAWKKFNKPDTDVSRRPFSTSKGQVDIDAITRLAGRVNNINLRELVGASDDEMARITNLYISIC